VCDQPPTLRAIERGRSPSPCSSCYDEFAALREARQVIDLLLQQDRHAFRSLSRRSTCLKKSQSASPCCRRECSSHIRIEAEDADVIAAQFGTHTTSMLTAQVNYATVRAKKAPVRWVEEYDMHPTC